MTVTSLSLQNVRRYASNARHYLDNGLVFLRSGDTAKSGEFLWGSIAEALKAVAASRGIHLASHSGLRRFATALAREEEDASLVEGVHMAESLHSNFYETELEAQDIVPVVDSIRRTLEKLFALIPEQALEETSAS